jgi:diguanylate cyclase (GGDEF)-like protein
MWVPEQLDIRTLLFMVGLISLLSAIAMATYARRFPQFPGLAWLALADACLCLGMYLVSMRDSWPDIFTVVTANIVTLAGLALNVEAFRRLTGPSWPRVPSPYWAFLVLVPGSWYFTFVEPGVHERILVFTGSAILVCTSMGAALWFGPAREESPRLRFSAAVFIGFALLLSARWLNTIYESPLPSFMQAGWVHAWVLISYIAFVLLKNFGVLQHTVKQLIDESKRLARVDELTGLPNRRAVLELAQRELERTRRSSEPLSLIMVDVDHFKAINDSLGHAAGDSLLVTMAQRLSGHLRVVDVCARFGGEEFLVLLPNTGIDRAAHVAEKLRAALDVPANDSRIGYSASFGVATLHTDVHLEALIARADAAMYRAKHAGRNRVVIG